MLIDEIDKADPDVPNGLLVPLGSNEFTVTPIEHRVVRREWEKPWTADLPITSKKDTAIPSRLLIVITTNEERDLPDAFVRRCITYRMSRRERSVSKKSRAVTWSGPARPSALGTRRLSRRSRRRSSTSERRNPTTGTSRASPSSSTRCEHAGRSTSTLPVRRRGRSSSGSRCARRRMTSSRGVGTNRGQESATKRAGGRCTPSPKRKYLDRGGGEGHRASRSRRRRDTPRAPRRSGARGFGRGRCVHVTHPCTRDGRGNRYTGFEASRSETPTAPGAASNVDTPSGDSFRAEVG